MGSPHARSPRRAPGSSAAQSVRAPPSLGWSSHAPSHRRRHRYGRRQDRRARHRSMELRRRRQEDGSPGPSRVRRSVSHRARLPRGLARFARSPARQPSEGPPRARMANSRRPSLAFSSRRTVVRRMRANARPQHLLESRRPAMLLEQIAERLVGQLLQGLHAVEREVMQRLPRLRIECDALANRAGRPTGTRRHQCPCLSWRWTAPR